MLKRHVKTNVHPGRILKMEVMEPNKITVGRMAELLQVSRLTISKIVNEKGGITPNIALRLEKVFGGNADFWLRLQRVYDLLVAKSELENNPLVLSPFEMAP